MYKIKMVLINMVITAMVGVAMQVVWVILSGKTDQLGFQNILGMMTISAIIGTICLFVLFYVTLKNTGSLAKAVITNIVLDIALCFAVYLETGLFFSNWTLDAKWIVILVIATTATLVMTIIWYGRIKYFNNKLELKKASLRKNKM